MNIYKFTIEATRDRFMERPLHDTFDDYIIANDYDQAHSFAWSRLNKAGWEIKKITGTKIIVTDIRDTSDQFTD